MLLGDSVTKALKQLKNNNSRQSKQLENPNLPILVKVSKISSYNTK